MRLLYLMLLFLLLSADAGASSHYFSRITSNNGLSENCVKSVVQDHLGFIWFGTKNGLNRYDCNTIKHYDVDDLVKKQGNHNISALFEDKNHNIWVGTDRGVYLYDPLTELFTLFDTTTDDGVRIRNWVSQIAADKRGNVWVIVPNQGAFRYDMENRTLKMFRTSDDDGTSQYHNPQSMCVLEDGDVWIGTNGAGIYRYDAASDRLGECVTADAAGHTIAEQNIYTMCEYGGWIILGVHEGKLVKYNPRTREFADVNAPRVHYKVIRSVTSDGPELFVGTQDGLFVINESKGTETQIREDDILPFGLSDNMIYTLYIDRNRGLWIGTMMSGACYMPRQGIVFSNYLPMRTSGSLSGKRIREMQCDGDGNVWIANEEGGVDVFNPETETFENIKTTIYKGGSNRLALMIDDDKVWSGIFKNGLDLIDIKTRAVTHYTPDMLGLSGEGSVYSLMRDRTGTVWLGSGNGLYIQSGDMHFTKVETLPNFFVQDMTEDRDGNVWIASIGQGVFCVDPKTWRSTNYTMEPGREGSLCSNDVSSITIDHKGNMWFSTDRGGICMFDKNTKEFVSYSKSEGLPDDIAYKILEDKYHYLWFGTDQGLVRFKPDTREVTVYRNNNGLLSNQYNYKSAVSTRGGKFIFGGTGGLVQFDPLQAGKNNAGKKVYITNLRVNNQEVRPGTCDILPVNIIYAEEIHLPYDISNICMDFTALNYSGTESNSYEYMLDGADGDWNITQDGRSIIYSKLQPGRYTFKVRPVGDSGHVTELKIIVSHPWWATMPARIIYVVLLSLLLYALWRMSQKRQTRQQHEREKRFMEEKDKDLLKAKISFFTDITHEIRTPLTLINGSVENLNEIMENSTPDDGNAKKAFEKNINAISKNCRRLLNLINQLLDFRKMDLNTVKLNFTNISVSRIMEEIVSRFEPTISRMNKTISLDMEDDDIGIAADGEAFTKIISNLLNNARKYSETFIQVSVRITDGNVEVRITNDGAKIPADKTEEIFKPFTRLDKSHSMPGSGLGLPMARSLAEMHGGRLVLNTASEYNEFVLTLPMSQDSVIEMAAEPETFIRNSIKDDTIADYPQGGTGDTDKEYTVLVVEDNAEVMRMIADKLSDSYNVLTAKNGRVGLDTVHREHVDIVISDVMMPVMDGQEMCRSIKNDIEVSHIPVILLTARQTLENRIDGLKAGADAYIEKPFSFGHLQVQMNTLLANRRRERENFIRKPYLPVQNSSVNKQEEEFLSRISDLIIKNIKQPEFNVEQLAAEMCMSRSSLHRKIKEVSNLTPIDFIRIIRLKKAAELIKEHGYRSSEVCEMVGISSPSYFIKLFQKQFGMTPKQFASRKEQP